MSPNRLEVAADPERSESDDPVDAPESLGERAPPRDPSTTDRERLALLELHLRYLRAAYREQAKTLRTVERLAIAIAVSLGVEQGTSVLHYGSSVVSTLFGGSP